MMESKVILWLCMLTLCRAKTTKRKTTVDATKMSNYVVTYGPDGANVTVPYWPEPHEDEVNFKKLLSSPYFVDKTMFLKSFLEPPNFVFVAYPSGFGKSAIVDMARRFFELTINYTTKQPVEDKKGTENYRMFTNPRWNLKIAQDKEFIERHLGEYPVIYVNFRHVPAYDYGEISKLVGIEVHKMYQRYHYLTDYLVALGNSSIKMEKEFGEKYLPRFIKILSGKWIENDIGLGLRDLGLVMIRYFRKRPILLVDGYDKPTISAITMVGYHSFIDIHFLLQDLFLDLFSGVHRAGYGLVTGISLLEAANTIGTFDCQITVYNSTAPHPYAEYFGLTESEVKGLITDGAERLKLKEFCNGYQIYDTLYHIYNTRDVITYAQSRSFDDYFDDGTIVKLAKNITRLPCVREQIEEILGHKELECFLFLNVSLTQVHSIFLYGFEETFTEPEDIPVMSCGFFLENGYFIPRGHDKEDRCKMVTNRKGELQLRSIWKSYYEKYNIDFINSGVVSSIRKFINDKDNLFEMASKQIKNQLSSILDQYLKYQDIGCYSYFNKKDFRSLINCIMLCHFEGAQTDVDISEQSQENTTLADIVVPNRNGTMITIVKIFFNEHIPENLVSQYEPIGDKYKSMAVKYLIFGLNYQYFSEEDEIPVYQLTVLHRMKAAKFNED